MRKINRYVALAFFGISMNVACDSFHSSSQTRVESNSPALSNGALISNKTVGTEKDDSRGAVVKRKPLRVGGCGSGLGEIPVELRQTFEEQNAQFKEIDDVPIQDNQLKTEVRYYGYIFLSQNDEKVEVDESKCSANLSSPVEVKFVEPQVNDLIKMYISAVIDNELRVDSLKRKLAENSRIDNNVALCVNIECGKKDPTVKTKSYNFLTSEDLDYARANSDTQLYGSIMNSIRAISQVTNKTQYLTDTEINQMIAVAGKIASNKVKELQLILVLKR